MKQETPSPERLEGRQDVLNLLTDDSIEHLMEILGIEYEEYFGLKEFK